MNCCLMEIDKKKAMKHLEHNNIKTRKFLQKQNGVKVRKNQQYNIAKSVNFTFRF